MANPTKVDGEDDLVLVQVKLPRNLVESIRQHSVTTGTTVKFAVEKFFVWWLAGHDPRTLQPLSRPNPTAAEQDDAEKGEG